MRSGFAILTQQRLINIFGIYRVLRLQSKQTRMRNHIAKLSTRERTPAGQLLQPCVIDIMPAAQLQA